jgi:hypothetical protein
MVEQHRAAFGGAPPALLLNGGFARLCLTIEQKNPRIY